MNKKLLISIIIIIVGGGLIWFARQSQDKVTSNNPQSDDLANQANTAPQDTPAETQPQTPIDSTPVNPVPTPPKTNDTGGTFSAEPEVTAPDVSVFEVTYDGNNFSPASLTVKAGDVVFFKNNSSSPFRPASNPHPSHTDYPGFDAGKGIAAGQRFEFKFNNIGTWGYHDHMNPSAKGTIIVTK